jgi:DNA-binding beta-propeller fold protein YncE
MNFVSERGDHRRLAVGSALIALVCLAALALTARAQAATENIYWDNYDASTISFSSIDGSGGGPLNLTGVTLQSPEGMAYDTVTNRLFVGSEGGPSTKGQIAYINLDGSGAGTLNTGAAPVADPQGVAVDPATRMIYWANSDNSSQTIGWANLSTGASGQLNTSGATVESPYKIAIDPVGGRVYWANTGPTESIGYANANNTGGGGLLNTTGAPGPEEITGFSADPAGGRLYWLDNGNSRIGFASLAPGGNGGEVNLTGSSFNEPYGMAFDPSQSRLYWANYKNAKSPLNAIGNSTLSGQFGSITPATAPVNGPQDPVILKSPTGTGAPTVARDAKNRANLSCSQGSWAADYPGSFVYQAPRTYAYQWLRNGKAVAGATAPTYTATKEGSFSCTVTAANQIGSAAQTSAGLTEKAAKVKLTTKKKAKAKAGRTVTFKINAVNQGDVKSGNAKVCAKLPKAAKSALKAPKCKSLGKLKGKAKKGAKLKFKVSSSAGGTYKVTFQVKGSPGKAAKSKIIVS